MSILDQILVHFMKNIITYQGIKPLIHENSFIAHNAIISGSVEVSAQCGIWYFCVIRGDVAPVKIGHNTNIQDGTTIHGTRPNHIANKTGAAGASVSIGSNVTVGHNCILHACTIQDEVFVGMGSILMDLSIMESGSMLAAGSLLTPGKVVKSGQLWGGSPARYIRDLRPEELAYFKTSADNYWDLAKTYKENV
jgi:carbonic anhydrase/acetyltransferase-like protein (isoleucine patch superfamily)